MFWLYLRPVISLSTPQKVVVFLTTFAIPVSFEVAQGWSVTGFCPPCVIWGMLATYVAWFAIALWVIAVATRQDRDRTQGDLIRMYSELTERLEQLSQENQRQATDMQDRVRDLQEWVRDTRQVVSEELKVDLPPMTHSIRAHFTGAPGSISASATVVTPSGRRVRLLRWVKRQARNLKRWGYRILIDWSRARE